MDKKNMNADKTMLRVGTTLERGKYRIDRYLSSGGFGNTYLATNIKFDEKVAIKEFFMKDINMRAGESTSVSLGNVTQMPIFQEQMEKFQKEAKRLRKLKHKNIVEVSDLFDENGTTYYVMDFIDGQSLRDMVQQRGKLVEQEVRGYLEQTLDALEVVHQTGFYHLDIKPANIMVDKTGRVRVIDFGASKQQTPDGGATSRSAICYTPGYAPIEQKDQERENFGPWTDLYALGATLYNCLTGETPPSTSKIADYGEEAFKFPPTISEEMKSLILWMMKGRRFDRPQSVADVKAFLKGEPVQKPPLPDDGDDEEEIGTILPGSEEHKRLVAKNIVENMILVKGGIHLLGNTDEGIPFDVSDFKINRFAVTQEEWQCFMGDNPSASRGSQKPVENVSWTDCQEFINKLNQFTDNKYHFRLPYPVEWEYAATGGDKHSGYKFAGGNSLAEVAWADDPSGTTHPVGQKKPNELGLYDMTGNVWEWCQSDNDVCCRGGAYNTPEKECSPILDRYYNPATRENNIGFRLASSVNGEKAIPPKKHVTVPPKKDPPKKEPPQKEPPKKEPPKPDIDNGKEKKGGLNKWLIYVGCAAVAFVLVILVMPKGSTSSGNGTTVDTIATLPVVNEVTDKAFTNPVLHDYLYTGPINDAGLPDGIGQAVCTKNGKPNGITYKGPFVNGTLNGSDAYFEIKGQNIFEGTFKDNYYYEGKLTQVSDGSYFFGTYKNAQPFNGAWYDKNGKELNKVVEGKNK